MSIIALTGGLGSGKSEAAKQFAKLGVPVVDTDVIAHALTANGAPALKQISELFGPQFLTNEGALDRAKLRAHVFAHPQERSKLEALLHPLIRAAALKQLAENEFMFSGRLELDYLEEKYGLEFGQEEAETLSGYIINHHETIPRQKERIIIDDYEFDIIHVTDTRIETVKMKKLK